MLVAHGQLELRDPPDIGAPAVQAGAHPRRAGARAEGVMSAPTPNRPFGIDFVNLTEAQLARDLASLAIPPDEAPRLLVTTNLNHVVDLARNARFRAAYRRAWRVTADGMPVMLYARLRGVPLRERLTGSGVFAALMPLLDPTRHRVYFLAPTKEVGALCRQWLIGRGFAPEAIALEVPERGFDTDDARSADLADRIRMHGTTHLVMGIGAPKSEIWAHRLSDRLGPCYVLCVGAGLEFFVGLRSRGPVWAQSSGLEWLWRFAQEPRRLFRRYFVDSWRFLACVVNDLRGRSLVDEP
jgi:N-acetylglucosaminyldiphosphoundecaprenol N-acetyl-beta-D-mannosaminyltransferase